MLVGRARPDTRHKAHFDDMTEGQVPETLGGSHPSANKDTTMARKIEYKKSGTGNRGGTHGRPLAESL